MSGATKLMTAGGGGVSLTPASSIASDVTVNVPSSNGTLVSTGETAQVSQAMLASGVAGNGPAFSAYPNASTTLANGTSTKVLFQAEEYDTNNNFASSTFTPSVAGYYQLTASVGFTGGTTGETVLAFYKNGSPVRYPVDINASVVYTITASVPMYMNGTTDYAEIYAYNGSGSSKTSIADSKYTYFSGVLVRAA